MRILLANAEGDHKTGQAQGPHPTTSPLPVPTYVMTPPFRFPALAYGRDEWSLYNTTAFAGGIK